MLLRGDEICKVVLRLLFVSLFFFATNSFLCFEIIIMSHPLAHHLVVIQWQFVSIETAVIALLRSFTKGTPNTLRPIYDSATLHSELERNFYKNKRDHL